MISSVLEVDLDQKGTALIKIFVVQSLSVMS